ncbi:MAG: Gx transporter family protein [Desulfuromonadales bacterium]
MTFSAAERGDPEEMRRRIFLALFTALAIALHSVEYLLPSPIPWFRFGFANILTVCALCLFGGRAAWWVTLGRILVGSFFLGRFFSPGFFLALAGGIAATALMTALRQVCGTRVGPIGLSVVGAAGHAIGQLTIAWLLLVRHEGMWLLLPFLLLSALVTGLINGTAADLLIASLRRHSTFAPAGQAEKDSSSSRENA